MSARLFGRGRELADLEGLVAGGERLVTLLGPGGVGKTTLALAFAARHVERHALPGGVVMCDLSEARTTEGVAAAVARALDLDSTRPDAAPAAIGRIGTAIDGRGASVVVLDNCEQAVSAVAEAVADWMSRAPRTAWIATSREPLRLRAEQVYPLPPLSLPVEGDVGASEAVQLFEACVQRRLPGYRVDAEQAPVVAEIVRRLDGLPLAIELAAARAARLGTRALLDRLDRPLDVLASGPLDASARQRTMRATVAWSWDLLEPAERAMLEQCSVFRAPFSVEAAAGVADLSTIEGAPPALDVIESLLDKSMLRSSTGAPDAALVAPYEVVRAFAIERLEASGGLATARSRHADYHARIARDALGGGTALRGDSARRSIDARLADFLAAHDTAVAARAGDDACALVLFCLPVLEAREPAPRVLERLDATLDASSGAKRRSDGGGANLTRVRIARGEARAAAGMLAAAREDLDRALAEARERRDARLEARALGALGLASWHGGDLERAATMLARAREVARAAGDEEELLAARRSANVAIERHRLDEAEDALAQARRLARGLGDERTEAIVLGTSSLVHHRSGRNDRALSDALEALELMRKTGDAPRAAVTLCNLGVIEQELGRHDAARAHLVEAATLAHRTGDRRLLGFSLGCQGRIEHEAGSVDVARSRFEDALRLLGDVGATRMVGLFRAALAAAHAALGDGDAAARQLDEAVSALAGAEAHVLATIDVYRALVEGRPAPAAARELAARDEDLRIALALLDRTGATKPKSTSTAPSRGASAAPSSGERLIVASDGTWFRAPGGAAVHLERRRNLRLVLVALSRGRLESPGRPMSVKDLVEAGWPGERMQPRAASMRVYATLTRLRKLGLAELIVSRGDGYLLDARVPLEMVEG